MYELPFDMQAHPRCIDCKYVIEYFEPFWKKVPHSKHTGQSYHIAKCLRCKVVSQQEQIDRLIEDMRDLKCESRRALNRLEQIEVK